MNDALRLDISYPKKELSFKNKKNLINEVSVGDFSLLYSGGEQYLSDTLDKKPKLNFHLGKTLCYSCYFGSKKLLG